MKTPGILLAGLLALPLFAQPPPAAPRPWSAGLFAASDSQPYRGAGGTFRVLPYVSYRGERLEWFGPLLRWKAGDIAGWDISLHGRVDFPAYEEDDAPILEGLGDRDTTLLLGLDASRELLTGLGLVLSAEGDALGRHDGYQLSAAFTRRIGSPRNPLSGGVSAGAHLQDENWTDYAVGVPDNKANAERPAYAPGTSLHPFVGARLLWRIDSRWTAMALVRCEFLDASWRDSPIVADDTRLTAVVSASWSF